MPEHVDGHAAARKPIAADAQIGRLDQIDDALADGDRRVLVEGPVIAEAREIELERLRFDEPALRRVVDDEMGEVGLSLVGRCRNWCRLAELLWLGGLPGHDHYRRRGPA